MDILECVLVQIVHMHKLRLTLVHIVIHHPHVPLRDPVESLESDIDLLKHVSVSSGWYVFYQPVYLVGKQRLQHYIPHRLRSVIYRLQILLYQKI